MEVKNQKELIKEINTLKKEKKAIILAHNYQRPEVQDIADLTGDSLGLSQAALKTDAEIIVLCGVYFMAETASIICPDKTVLLPDLKAGCDMAQMASLAAVKKMRIKYPEATFVCYVNSTAEVKAECDVCCTSANAVDLVHALPANRQYVLLPDQNLAKYVAKSTKREVIFWEGCCPSHHLLKPKDILKIKKEHPEARVIAHPECQPDVLAEADHICSTSAMNKYILSSGANEFIIATEIGMLYGLKRNNPSCKFYPASPNMVCSTMKLITLEDIYASLKKMKYEINVPEEIRVKAKKTIDRMFEVLNVR
ncbi:MAG: quinolinate synthase NadA [bacterium]